DCAAACSVRDEVGMAPPTPGRSLWNSALRFEKCHEGRARLRQRMAIETPETDVQKILLPETPAVAFEVAAKVKFRLFRRDPVRRGVACVQRELNLLCDDERRTIRATEHSGNRTKVTARADEHRSGHRFVENPARPVPADPGDRSAELQTRARSLQ